MKIKKQKWGVLSDGTKVHLYTVSNDNMSFSCTDYGCTITSIIVKDKNGNPVTPFSIRYMTASSSFTFSFYPDIRGEEGALVRLEETREVGVIEVVQHASHDAHAEVEGGEDRDP